MIRRSRRSPLRVWKFPLPAVLAEAVEFERVPLYRESTGCRCRREICFREADIDFFDTATTGTDEMVVMVAATDPVTRCAIGKLDAVNDTKLRESVDRAKEGRAPQARVLALELTP